MGALLRMSCHGFGLELTWFRRDDALTGEGFTVTASKVRHTVEDWVHAWRQVEARTRGTEHDIACIALDVGPGSFTSLRLAASFGQGLARGLGVSTWFAFSWLEELARGAAAAGESVAVVLPHTADHAFVAIAHPGAAVQLRSCEDIRDWATLGQTLQQEVAGAGAVWIVPSRQAEQIPGQILDRKQAQIFFDHGFILSWPQRAMPTHTPPPLRYLRRAAPDHARHVSAPGGFT